MKNGFTLIELLVVLTIIGVIAATAVPAYKEYKARSFDFRALSDLRGAALAEEAYFLDNETYLSCENQSCLELPGLSRLSSGVSLTITAEESGFQATSTHSKGTGRQYTWDSNSGGLLD